MGATEQFAVALFPLLVLSLVLGAIFLFPFRRIFLRAGINKNLAYLAFLPVLGVLILLGIAAFKEWPNEPGGYR